MYILILILAMPRKYCVLLYRTKSHPTGNYQLFSKIKSTRSVPTHCFSTTLLSLSISKERVKVRLTPPWSSNWLYHFPTTFCMVYFWIKEWIFVTNHSPKHKVKKIVATRPILSQITTVMLRYIRLHLCHP